MIVALLLMITIILSRFESSTLATLSGGGEDFSLLAVVLTQIELFLVLM